MQKWEYLHLQVSFFVDEEPQHIRIASAFANGVLDVAPYPPPTETPRVQEMLKWPEYLASLGEQGWELVTTVHLYDSTHHREFIFKRPL